MTETVVNNDTARSNVTAPHAAATAKSGNGSPARSRKAARGGNPVITPAQRTQMISELAYLRAEARGFAGGDPVEDWLAAEAEVDARLA